MFIFIGISDDVTLVKSIAKSMPMVMGVRRTPLSGRYAYTQQTIFVVLGGISVSYF